MSTYPNQSIPPTFIMPSSLGQPFSMPKTVNQSMTTRKLNHDNPHQEHQAALEILHQFSDEAIQGFIIYARSINFRPPVETGIRHPDALSSEQLNAIEILKDFPCHLIVSWRSKALSRNRTNPNSLCDYRHTPSQWPPLTDNHSFSRARSPSEVNIATEASSQHLSFPNGAQGDASKNEDLALPIKSPQIACWCTHCSQPRRFETKDGWARHEREKHERHIYPCMPNGAIEFTLQGPTCAICQMANPDEDHLNSHQVTSCLGASLSTPVFERRVDLVNHLKIHGVLNGRGLAENWKCAPTKKSWACGFCVRYFPQRMDRINHIYIHHYSRGVNIQSWDNVKVIQGLLLQPLLSDLWSNLLSSKHPYVVPEIIWPASVVKSLQTRLEMCEESPETLVAAAYQHSNLGLRFLGDDLTSPSDDTALALISGQVSHYLHPDPCQPSNEGTTAENDGLLDWNPGLAFDDVIWNDPMIMTA